MNIWVSDDQPITVVHSVRAPPQAYRMEGTEFPKPPSYGCREPGREAKGKTMKLAPKGLGEGLKLGSGETRDLGHDMGHKQFQGGEPYQDTVRGKVLRTSLEDDTKAECIMYSQGWAHEKSPRRCSTRKRNESG